MKVTYSPKAYSALQEIHAYITERNPRAAQKVVATIETQCLRLGRFPGLGRPTDFEGIRVLPVTRYPYLIFYSIFLDTSEIRILRIRHGARKPIEAADLED